MAAGAATQLCSLLHSSFRHWYPLLLWNCFCWDLLLSSLLPSFRIHWQSSYSVFILFHFSAALDTADYFTFPKILSSFAFWKATAPSFPSIFTDRPEVFANSLQVEMPKSQFSASSLATLPPLVIPPSPWVLNDIYMMIFPNFISPVKTFPWAPELKIHLGTWQLLETPLMSNRYTELKMCKTQLLILFFCEYNYL